MSESKRLLVLVGSYAEAENEGIYAYELNEDTGSLAKLDGISGVKNPTFVNVDAQANKLYAIGETASAEGNKMSEAVALSVDPSTGKLTLLNRKDSISAPPCHIQRDPSGKYLILSSYHGGLVGLQALTDNGEVGALLDEKKHEGHGAHPERQDKPHVHSAFFSPDGKYMMVQDLGADKIAIYSINADTNELVLHSETKTHPGAGPRHLAFHPNAQFAYVINEVDSSITSYKYDAAAGTLTEISNISTLPDGYDGAENTTAEITVSNDGRFVYGSNRGHDSIVVFAVDADKGHLSLVEHVSAEGQHPRHFALTPNGKLLIAANRDTNNMVTFTVDQESGRLKYTGHSTGVSKPVCVKPVYL
ncbi:6-phosphogluconolactonase [Paenibacillus polysaccharolyticus]|uniref:6-phosphogluconolactonase n=1 Tax=Paenibacillus polysaccharolyticus TaxID=582692 RepID=A0A1G5IQG7_9BACL|nr:lactonase family protein [Paenibacillus polysaccharolyticus]SCY78227.1 6-phosphogluconolactonase [Paenibacillus polysaccharolyticus]